MKRLKVATALAAAGTAFWLAAVQPAAADNALTMSDRVAVFESGTVAQIGTPDALYKEPGNAFVANFIGENNSLQGTSEQVSGGECLIALGAGVRVAATAVGEIGRGERVTIAIRPEQIALAAEDGARDTRIAATAEGRIYLGDHQRLLARLANGEVLTVKLGADSPFAVGQTVTLAWSASDCRAFGKATETVSNSGRNT